MKFTKLNESAIKCLVTKEELDEYGVELEDLMCNRDKAELFLRHIMTEAKYELDFDMPTSALAVSINVMPEGDISLMIADKSSNAVSEIMNTLRGLAENFDTDSDVMECPKVAENLSPDLEPKASCVTLDGPAWAEFDSIDTVIRLSKQISNMCIIMSQLYKHNDHYYLRFELNDNTAIGKIYIACSEYSDNIFLDKTGGAYIMEHGRLLMDEDAIFTLAGL